MSLSLETPLIKVLQHKYSNFAAFYLTSLKVKFEQQNTEFIQCLPNIFEKYHLWRLPILLRLQEYASDWTFFAAKQKGNIEVFLSLYPQHITFLKLLFAKKLYWSDTHKKYLYLIVSHQIDQIKLLDWINTNVLQEWYDNTIEYLQIYKQYWTKIHVDKCEVTCIQMNTINCSNTPSLHYLYEIPVIKCNCNYFQLPGLNYTIPKAMKKYKILRKFRITHIKGKEFQHTSLWNTITKETIQIYFCFNPITKRVILFSKYPQSEMYLLIQLLIDNVHAFIVKTSKNTIQWTTVDSVFWKNCKPNINIIDYSNDVAYSAHFEIELEDSSEIPYFIEYFKIAMMNNSKLNQGIL
ncbi:MAG: hypothetical protein GY938_00435, partial [Ketobacter sp.]|nr:hypothetical protein [Ketobacter sp.]